MGFLIKKKEELESLSNDEVMEYMLESEKSIKKTFDVTYIDLSTKIEGLQYKKELSFDDINKYFTYDNDDGNYTFVFFDERDLPIYKQVLNGGFKVPSKNFWWVIECKLVKKQLGIFVVMVKIGKMVRNESDWRWIKDDKPAYEEEKIFYYDYENDKFLQVFLNSDKKKGKKKKQEESEEKSEREIYIEEYKKRMEVINYIDERMARIEDEYAHALNDATGSIIRLNSEHTSHNYGQMFKEFTNFKTEQFDKFFSIKLSLGHVDFSEYVRLTKYMNEVAKKVTKASQKNNELQEIYSTALSYVREPYQNKDDVKSAYDDYMKTTYDQMVRILKPRTIVPFNYKNKDKVTIDGYYDYSNLRLYPSLGTVELRRSLTKIAYKKSDWDRYEKILLSALIRESDTNKNEENNESVVEREESVSAPRLFFRKNDLEYVYDDLLEARKTNRIQAQMDLRYYLEQADMSKDDINEFVREYINEAGKNTP